jgi:hypothetical protein
MNRWDKSGIPHKGWQFKRIEDPGGEGDCDDITYEQCDMCGKEKIRYVHILGHPDYGEIRVGCVCASKMLEDYVNPQQRENDLKNRLNRRRSFMKQNWKYKGSTGNYYLRYKGEYITIARSKYGPGLGVIFRNQSVWKYNDKKINDLHTAKMTAFELFDALHVP